ncbi:type VII secretion protein EssC [Oceanobacillus sp. J11TS1]|uniref:type VII secretion protein EssC n=1 Tax=Oceanobacillus sp. J11TS1 TaxID=2807191 RepID=UPI001B0BE0E9|nr:type VII secretion protein EssC [Oceanobacillus sp. J11TS1]GIO23676.1 type VII secretion protein EssC [Oceanobacillus sp. J11TS1]
MAENKLTVSYENELHTCRLPLGEEKEITIGKDWADTITFLPLKQCLSIAWNGEACIIADDVLYANEQKMVHIEGRPMHFYLSDVKGGDAYDIAAKRSITFSSNQYDDVCVSGTSVDFVLLRERIERLFKLEVHQGEVFHNYVRISGDVVIEPGDQLFFDGVTVIMGEEDMHIIAPGDGISSKLVSLVEADHRYNAEYPDYHRSPRIIYREPTDKRIIAKPANKPSKPSEQLARTIVPPLVMIAALVIVSIIHPRGIFIIVMLAMTVTTIIFAITSYIKSVKKYKANMKERDKTYREYLQRKTKELYHVSEEQRHALNYHYPNVAQIRQMAKNVDARIYEKTLFHHDFLNYRVGLGKVDLSFEIDFKDEEFDKEKDELIDAARELYSQYREIEQVPVVTSLMNGPVGYIGPRHLVLEQLQLFVMQTALFHSYHDLQFITVFPEEEKNEWNWMRWLPHASMQGVNVRGFVYHERSRDQVLHSLYQILKERKLVLDEKTNKNEKTYFTPHYVVLITDEKIILDHTIMEFFNEDPSELGVSLVFVQDVMQSLPEHVTTVIDLRDVKSGNILLEEGELVNKHFALDHFPSGFNKEDVSRALAPLNHLQSLKNSIPESVTFLEMYGVEKVEELAIARRWQVNETYKSLAVPLGLRGKDDIVNLNLHEKAHGPHGLIAGTTGSGKSEIIQSYIISLAVNFHPYEVAFLLIDYKGGGMANLFKNMPHLLGTITNLDRTQSMRALASIKAELKKRQRLFGEHDVNHINQYQKLYNKGEASEAMPHLFLISDEFAELKAEQPDFMKELVSTARIGRSLGIHLILATQKPSGVVDDQIWSNSKFKLALKVQNASDSNEILKTPDAAEITLPGRSYLQVGNNEIYELFQSAWSGADYVLDKNDHELVDTTIYAINDLGQYDILTEDLSGLDKKEEIEKVPTELDAVIDYIHDYAEEQQIEPLPRPWLPPLPERIFAEDLHPVNFEEAWSEPKKPLCTTIGLLDQPELQAQEPLTLNLTKDGHIAVFSSPGYGKSTFLQTVIMDLVKQHHPEHLHVYLLDFGTNGLLPLKDIPHVADTMLMDEVEKIGKWVRLISNTIKERKKKLSLHGVANMEMYEKASGETVPNIFIAIDNYDPVREADFGEEFDKLITQIAREGASIGLHLAISAGRQGAMKMPLVTNIKLQVALYLIEISEMRSIIGRTDLETEEIPGRGLIKLEEPTLFQVMLPAEGTEALDIIDAIQDTAKQMDEHWKGERPESIPMMPEGAIDFEQFKKTKKTRELVENQQLPLGLEFEEVTPLAFDPAKFSFLTVVSDRKDGLDKLTHALAKNMTMLNDAYYTMLIDTNDQPLADTGNQLDAYFSNAEDMRTVKEKITTEIRNRMQGEADQTKWLIMIKDLKDFSTRSNLDDDEPLLLWEEGPSVGIHFIVCGDNGFIGSSIDSAAKYIRRQSTIGLFAMKIGDQDILNQPFIRKEKYPNEYECYYAMDYEHMKIKIPK